MFLRILHIAHRLFSLMVICISVAEKDTAELQTLLDSLRNKMESEMQQPLLDIERERDELQQKVRKYSGIRRPDKVTVLR